MLAAALVGRDMGLFKLTTHCGGGGGLKAGFEAIALRIAVLSRDRVVLVVVVVMVVVTLVVVVIRDPIS